MQLDFLGEKFEKDHCKLMCDNCKTNNGPQYQVDLTEESKVIVDFLIEAMNQKVNFSILQTIGVVTGKYIKTAEFVEKFKGKLEKLNDS